MPKRRNEKVLKEAVRQAKTPKTKALAHYHLGLFHDNNAREAMAITNYMIALKLGLERPAKGKALAWLASSLHKAGKPKEALAKIKESRRIADKELLKFLKGLERRILSKQRKI